MASIAGWWAIPVVALVSVVIWTMWRGRTPKPMGMRDSVAHYELFQAVLTRVVAGGPGDTAEGPAKNARRARADAHPTKNHRPGGATDWAADRLLFPEDPNAAEPRAAAHRDVP